MFYPSLVVAILAGVVASQTMITATFQVRSHQFVSLLCMSFDFFFLIEVSIHRPLKLARVAGEDSQC